MAKRARTEQTDPTFDGPGGTAAGWHVPIPGLFRDQLDIVLMERVSGGLAREVWTQGDPPAYRFRQGDVLYRPELVRHVPWGAAVVELAIQVTEAAPCSDGAGADGLVVFTLWRGKPGEVPAERFRGSQRQFVAFLRTGGTDGLAPLQ